MKKLLLGIGNDLRGDDAIGTHIVDHILHQKKYPNDVAVENVYSTGLGFISSLYRFEKLVIVDSVQMNDDNFGQYFKVLPQQIRQLKMPLRTTHGFNLQTWLSLGKRIGFENPKETILFLVSIRRMVSPQFECSDEISAPLKELVPRISREIIEELNRS